MTTLSIFHQDHPDAPEQVIGNPAEIAHLLKAKGIRYERWPTRALPADATQEDILHAYGDEVEHLKQESGFATADVISLTADHPEKEALRRKFLDEHTHSEDEVRFFVRGQGLFYLHLDERVYAVMCRQCDLISVPNGTRHWFDMGPEPEFTCIRLFTNPEGWVAEFTGEPIASHLPRYEKLAGVT